MIKFIFELGLWRNTSMILVLCLRLSSSDFSSISAKSACVVMRELQPANNYNHLHQPKICWLTHLIIILTDGHPPDYHYHQLYRQSKCNVSIFIKQVQQQISHIIPLIISKRNTYNINSNPSKSASQLNPTIFTQLQSLSDSFYPSPDNFALKESSELIHIWQHC